MQIRIFDDFPCAPLYALREALLAYSHIGSSKVTLSNRYYDYP